MKAARLALLALALLGALATQASAAAPEHPRRPSLDVEGLNHACGVATDSQGDLYLSSAGKEAVVVYGPEDHETPLAEVANPNEPCGLAVTSTGTLYVSEQGTGEVVRYLPEEFPFEGAPSYGPREVIDASGEARGISVDPFDDRLYVAEGGHVTAYDAEGKLGTNETQQVRCFGCTGGSYTLIFEGEETKEIPFEGPAEEFEAILLELGAFEAGDISVKNGSNDKIHLVSFEGKYAHTDVEAFECNASVEGTGSECKITEPVAGFSGLIGAGELTEATGVAAYTYETTGSKRTYHLAVADDAADQLKLFSAPSFKEQQRRRTLPEEGEEALSFGTSGAYLGSDAGSCPPEGQACTAGHFFFYDAERELIEEYEASGELVSQTPFEYGDAQPTAVAVDRSGSEEDGTLYVTTGAGAGARALAFDPLAAPGRPGPEEPPLSLTLPGTRGIDVDVHGYRYVAAEASIAVYAPAGEEPLFEIEPEASEEPRQVKVDSECNVYARLKDEIVYYPLSSCPPTPETTAGSQTTVAERSSFNESLDLQAIAVNPANDHLFATNAEQTIEFKSVKEGSGIVDPEFGAGLGISARVSLAVYGANSHVYISTGSGNGTVYVLDAAGKEILARISGAGSPSGPFGARAGAIDVDQSNGHVIAFESEHEAAREYEASGTFVAVFGTFTNVIRPFDVAVDNSPESPNQGTVYVAFDDPNPEVDPYDLTAFGGLVYGQKPLAKTGLATEVDAEAGQATLNGTVDPNGPPLEDCRFEYLTEAAYEANLEAEEPPFAGAKEAGCEPKAAEIGTGTEPVPVEARIGELDLEGRYRFGLVASNEYGTSEGDPGILGPPLAKDAEAKPVLYDEATLHARLDPSGLPGEYRFEYLTETEYEANLEAEEPPFAGAQSTPQEELGAGDGLLAVEASLEGLAQGTPYRFQVVADNEAGEAQAEGQFTTFEEPLNAECPNSALRTGPSAALPDCRAYELISPGQSGGYTPYWGIGSFSSGNFATALAAADGQSVVFRTDGPLPGTNGNGALNGYRAQRGADGWDVSLYGPAYAEISSPSPGGVSADQRYSFWVASGGSGSLVPPGGAYARYLVLPEAGADPACEAEPTSRFAWIGCGSEGIDPEAIGRWISPGAGHVIFTSDAHLEPDTPAEGKTAIYDRSPGGATHVVSLLPGGKVPSGDASYRGVSADGSAVAFYLGPSLYVRRDNAATFEVGTGAGFAGLARDGSALFYRKGGALWRFDIEGEAATQIAAAGDLVNVAADGTRAYFTSTEELAPGAEAGVDNLYLWEAEGDTTAFAAVLDPSDVTGDVNLTQWVEGLSPEAGGNLSGPAIDPSRSTPNGRVLLFESHAPLTGYDSQGHTEVFRYESEGGTLACLSCGPEGTVAESDARLQDETYGSIIVSALAPIANLSEDGRTAFFSSAEPLLPADRNGVADVYGWREGRLALISTGQSEQPSYLYAASASGDDVFFATREGLVPADEEEGGMSIYDARVGGGFPAPAAVEVCEGESCREAATAPLDLKPQLPTVSQSTQGAKRTRRPCSKGERRVKRKGRVRCVKRKGKRRRHRAHRRHRRRAR